MPLRLTFCIVVNDLRSGGCILLGRVKRLAHELHIQLSVEKKDLVNLGEGFIVIWCVSIDKYLRCFRR